MKDIGEIQYLEIMQIKDNILISGARFPSYVFKNKFDYCYYYNYDSVFHSASTDVFFNTLEAFLELIGESIYFLVLLNENGKSCELESFSVGSDEHVDLRFAAHATDFIYFSKNPNWLMYCDHDVELVVFANNANDAYRDTFLAAKELERIRYPSAAKAGSNTAIKTKCRSDPSFIRQMLDHYYDVQDSGSAK